MGKTLSIASAMHITQRSWRPAASWSEPLAASPDWLASLVLAFGPPAAPPKSWFDDLRAAYPIAHLVYVSGGGQIAGIRVHDDETVVSAIRFDEAQVRAIAIDGAGHVACDALGATLGAELKMMPGLRHVLVFTDGLVLNGSAFVRGLNAALPAKVGVSGGLASDGTTFAHTAVGLDGPPVAGRIVALGLAGPGLVIGAASAGGWDSFGPNRVVTRASGAVVYELDDEPALDVYRRYLGAFAAELPGSALLFPLAMRSADGDTPIVRTILGIDEAAGSLRFAGEVPEGSMVRLMRADTDSLLDGAAQAAERAQSSAPSTDAGSVLALCVSCIGRRALLRSRVEEELDEVRTVAGGAVMTGFYSNGEIGPHDSSDGAVTVLHNQTMTVTLISER